MRRTDDHPDAAPRASTRPGRSAWLTDIAQTEADVFRALAEPRRRQILQEVVRGPVSVNVLRRRLGCSKNLLWHHLGVLAAAEIVEIRGEGVSARVEALQAMSRYFDLALLGVARAQGSLSLERRRGARRPDAPGATALARGVIDP